MTVRGVANGGAMKQADGSIKPIVQAEEAGPPGAPGAPGEEGPNGWTPMFAGEADGTRGLLKVIDWVGGAGTKPAVGYVGGTGATGLVAKAQAFNFNVSKRIESYTAVTRTTAGSGLGIGEQSITFTTAFPAAPRIVATARASLSGRPVAAEVVSVTATGCVVRASQAKATLASLLSAVFDLLGGVTIDVLVIEA